jgi:hypothetical protein
LQGRLPMVPGGIQAQIKGTYEIKNGKLMGSVVDSELEPFTVPPTRYASLSIHLCYLAVRNGLPAAGLIPEVPLTNDRSVISATPNTGKAYKVPDFKFEIDASTIDNVGPPYLCALAHDDVDSPFNRILFF